MLADLQLFIHNATNAEIKILMIVILNFRDDYLSSFYVTIALKLKGKMFLKSHFPVRKGSILILFFFLTRKITIKEK